MRRGAGREQGRRQPGSRTIDALTTYAALAEIFGAVAIVGGGLFALVQLSEYRKRRRTQAAAELCRRFVEADLARSIILLRSMPDGAGIEEYQARGPEYEQAAQIVGNHFETMGLLVTRTSPPSASCSSSPEACC